MHPDPFCQSRTILLVDDERAVRQVVCSMLQMQGYTVLEAGRGVDALRICEQHEGPIHLLLTDVFMPEMNGLRLAEQVVALHPQTRILYMSGHPDGAPIAHLDLKTKSFFIQKPFTPDALARKVREVLSSPA
jgi:DNA-binding NtrC family response regulator